MWGCSVPILHQARETQLHAVPTIEGSQGTLHASNECNVPLLPLFFSFILGREFGETRTLVQQLRVRGTPVSMDYVDEILLASLMSMGTFKSVFDAIS